MKTTRLTVLAALSFAFLAILLSGYIVQIGPAWQYNALTSPTPAFYTGNLTVGEGRVKWIWQSRTALPVGVPPGFQWRMLFQPQLPSPSRSIWEFDAHPLITQPRWRAYIFAFPIWCLALPFTIAPALWFRRRRRDRGDQRGFAVEPQPTLS